MLARTYRGSAPGATRSLRRHGSWRICQTAGRAEKGEAQEKDEDEDPQPREALGGQLVHETEHGSPGGDPRAGDPPLRLSRGWLGEDRALLGEELAQDRDVAMALVLAIAAGRRRPRASRTPRAPPAPGAGAGPGTPSRGPKSARAPRSAPPRSSRKHGLRQPGTRVGGALGGGAAKAIDRQPGDHRDQPSLGALDVRCAAPGASAGTPPGPSPRRPGRYPASGRRPRTGVSGGLRAAPQPLLPPRREHTRPARFGHMPVTDAEAIRLRW